MTEVTGEQMWLAVYDPCTREYIDPTHGRDDFIPQAVLDHGGWLMFDITEPDAEIPVSREDRDRFFNRLEGGR